MIVSSGTFVKSPTYQEFTPASWNGYPQPGITQALRWGSYSAIYRSHLWVAVLVNKRANAQARLPLKTYRRDGMNRPEAEAHPYSELLKQPSKRMDPFLFWLWVRSTWDIFGEAVLLKIRDAGGRPVELVPWHPTRVHDHPDGRWEIDIDGHREEIARRDMVIFRDYNPDSVTRGMSRLEPLRATLENEDGARRANSALWRNGGRPSVLLKHPKTLSQPAIDRLSGQWSSRHGGAENWAKPAVLEEGMEAQILTLNSEELQYVESRRLNREEACAIFDVPPPVVHILDHATFSNITEQMRSMYRDTMAPPLRATESTLELELRDGRFGENREPDFGADVYCEFLLDEVLRGSFEARATAHQAAINSGWETIADVRRMENLPFIEGTDQILVNSTLQPLDQIGNPSPPADVRSVMGRLSWQSTPEEVDAKALTLGLNGHTTPVLAALAAARAEGDDMAGLRARVRAALEAS